MRPGRVLAFNAAAAVVLLVVAMTTAGRDRDVGVLAIGLFNSIMFPTIFTLAIDGLGKRTGEGSGVLCMAIVGGAIVPVIHGYFADTSGFSIRSRCRWSATSTSCSTACAGRGRRTAEHCARSASLAVNSPSIRHAD